jgi:hypothetical protein
MEREMEARFSTGLRVVIALWGDEALHDVNADVCA